MDNSWITESLKDLLNDEENTYSILREEMEVK